VNGGSASHGVGATVWLFVLRLRTARHGRGGSCVIFRDGDLVLYGIGTLRGTDHMREEWPDDLAGLNR
jgi:hypothetical protein